MIAVKMRRRDVPTEKVLCSICGKVVVGRVPYGGDGSVLYPRWHKDRKGKVCDGRYTEGKQPLRLKDR